MDDERRHRDPHATPTLPGQRPAPPANADSIASGPTLAVGAAHAPTVAAVGSGAGTSPRTPSPVAAPAELPVGVRPMIGHFAVHSRLGAGGMGEVFAGVDVDLGRAVAIKLVRADVDSEGYRARLLREAQAMARLEHPNVVRVYEIGNDGGRLFVAMELVDGVTLSQWLRAPHAWPDIVAMFEQVGAGLVAVHRAGLVHRDFKPDNVLVDRNDRARVADFGLARLAAMGTASPMAGALTQTGAVMGTPAYMAPEQQFGQVVDARADQYSFCVALREALLQARAWDAVPALRTAVARGLSYDASERFATLDELLDALRAAREQHAGVVVAAAPPPAAVAESPLPIATATAVTRTRNRGLVVAVASLVVVAAAVTTIALVREPPKPPDATAAAPSPAPSPPPPIVASTAVADAAVATTPPAPSDAAALAVVGIAPSDATPPPTPHRARRDAGAAPAPSVTVAPTPAATTGSPPELTPATVQSARLPAADVANPGHTAVVRDTIRDLDYDLVDLDKLDHDAQALQAALEHDRDAGGGSGDDAPVADVQLGMLARRRGDCATAESLWRAATKQLVRSKAPTAAAWSARAWFGIGLCALAAGQLDDALDAANRGWVNGERNEVELALALIHYDKGEREVAHAMLAIVDKRQDPRVQPGLARWLAGTGLRL